MAGKTTIEWTDATWNPVRGCRKVSPGCKHCYAEAFAERFRGVPGHPYENGFDLRLAPDLLAEPLRWPEPRTVFVNSMSDLFEERIAVEYVEAVCKVMALANWHTYQVLTKRASRMRELLAGRLSDYSTLRHIWWGVSVENRKHGLPRLEELRATPAHTRFLSIEPLLENLGDIELDGIDWVIVGGESGRGARPMEKEWVTSIRDQCKRQHVPFFFKQWGGVRKKITGRKLEGKTYDALPRRRTTLAPPRPRRKALVLEVERLSSTWESVPIAIGRPKR